MAIILWGPYWTLLARLTASLKSCENQNSAGGFANATYFGLVGQAILPAAAFQAALFGPRASLRTRKRPAESRLQPGLAAPQFLQNLFPSQSKWHWAKPPAPPMQVLCPQWWGRPFGLPIPLAKHFL